MKRLFFILAAFWLASSAKAQDASEKTTLRTEIENDLANDILPFWAKYAPDTQHGGFYGTILSDGQGVDSPKSAVLGSRIIWTFSKAYEVYGKPEYRQMADRLQQYYIRNFIDPEYGGVYYLVKPEGGPADDSKQTYASAYAIYGLSEHYRATGDTASLSAAKELFRTLEDKVHDRKKGGYLEAFARNYKKILAVGVDEKSGPTKTMNTHIHVLEAYTNLFRVWPDDELRNCLQELIGILETKLYDPQRGHLILYCDDDWNSLYTADSYGHDIETSWLLTEAAEVLGDKDVLKRIRKQAVRMTDVALAEGLTKDGNAMTYEKSAKGYQRQLSWWCQCETVIGCLNAWQITGEREYFDQAVRCWNFIKTHYIDSVHGGWWKNLDENGNHNERDPKASMWNCPYHNSRLGFETMRRLCGAAAQENLKLNSAGYFERRGINLLVYSNTFNGGFNDEKNSGIELILHGMRIAQGGAIRLNNAPEQWDLVPATVNRKVDPGNNSIEVTLRYEDYDFDSRIVVTGVGDAARIDVYLDKPVPAALVGKAGFNLEFLPSQYWLKTFTMDGRLGRFPRYAVESTVTRPDSDKPRQFKGFKTYDDRGTDAFVDPVPFEKGKEIVLASDSPERMVTVTSDTEMGIYDGRLIAQNGWYVLRSLLPGGKTGKVMSWTVNPHAIPGWVREPNIGFSQVGYLPDQKKVAVVELDRNYPAVAEASLVRVENGGVENTVFTAPVTAWGRYYKYNYVKFDFSPVTSPGVYRIKFGDTKTGDFIINNNVYDEITDATTDVWVPVHMDHMKVNEGYRVWHGEMFREGYLQAPPSDHFDLHFQGDSTETKYQPYELIPGLNVGGYIDAGDFDIETGSNISVVQNLVRTWELFRSERDETFVSQKQRYVDLHRPDGVPDILQYIEHGTLNLLAQAEKIGHMATTLSNSVLFNYHHLGDISAITDGLHYDRSLKPYEVSKDGKSSGTPDDMWAFTTRNPMLDFRAATMFAAVSHALKGYNDDLAERSLVQSKRLRAEAEELMKRPADDRHTPGENDSLSIKGYGDMTASLMLYGATGEKQYLRKFESMIWKALDHNVSYTIQTALDAIPYMDAKYRKRLVPYVWKYKEYVDGLYKDNPYGIPVSFGNWAGNAQIASFGTTVCFAHKYYPEIVGRDYIFRAADYLFGCHPYHNYSFVATLGAARPKNLFYGNNRADFSFIPGNMAPGLLFHNPDHFENMDDWPFLWGENEGTIAANIQYVIYGSALKGLLGNTSR